MLRRILRLALALSLAAGAGGATADARGFAQAPDTQGEVAIRPDPRLPAPPLSDAARAKLRAILAAHRAKNVASFRRYALRGVYPHNYVRRGSLNVWTDRDGHMCAAATMIFMSGQKALVRKVAKTQNYLKLADVTGGPLLDWILTSGLTHQEVIAIQAPMVMPSMPPEPDPSTTDWRIAEDAKLRQHYDQVLVDLGNNTDASLEAAIDALATHPELVAKLIA